MANIHYTSSGTPDLVNIWVTIGRGNNGAVGTFFLLDDLSFGPALSVDEQRIDLPSGFELSRNYPNPFNPTTTLSFVISHPSFVTLTVYDVLGREVATLVNEVKQAGEYAVPWNAEGIASGVYLYRLSAGSVSGQAGEFMDIKKMLILK